MKSIACPSPEKLNESLESIGPLDDAFMAHLESCTQCQATMNFIAGQSTWWEEAHRCLSTEIESNADRISSRICALTDATPAQACSETLLEHEQDQLRRMLAAPSHPELLGRIGRYELEQLVGRGGMGLVFRAYDSELYRVVAIKTLAFHLIPIPAARERFVRESRACAALTHPHIVPMYDVIHDGPIPALVMQYVAGPTLQRWLQEQGPIPWRDALRILGQLADALTAAHAHGLVHRDIKPGNVLLDVDGTRALLTDFGLARVLDAATLTHSGFLAGTPDFMSPEQARGEVVDERSDLFSLGSLLYTMLCGRTPFAADEPMAILHKVCHSDPIPIKRVNEKIPLGVSKLVEQLLAKQPKHRIQTAAEVRDRAMELTRNRGHGKSRMAKWKSPIAIGALLATTIPLAYASGWIAVVGSPRQIERIPQHSGLAQSNMPTDSSALSDSNPSDRSSSDESPSSPKFSTSTPTATSEQTNLGRVSIAKEFYPIDRELDELSRQTDKLWSSMSEPSSLAGKDQNQTNVPLWRDQLLEIQLLLRRLERELGTETAPIQQENELPKDPIIHTTI